jgi:transposase
MYKNACNSAQAFAREVGVHRTTVVEWIKKGRVKALPHKKGERWYIGEKQFGKDNVERLKKPYPKYSKPYSEAELHVIRNATEDIKTVAKMLGRSPNAIKIKRHRMRKEGIL